MADDDVDSIDEDIPETHRRISFVGARNSQELIALHFDKTIASQLRHGIDNLFFGPYHVRIVLSLLVGCALMSVCSSLKQPERGQDWLELAVCCMAYGLWFVFCMPMLLATLNLRLLVQVLHVVLRVFFAEIAVMMYAYYRGHNNILRRGFSLFPTLEANRSGIGLAWLGEAGYNLRLASLVSCFIIAFAVVCIEIWVNKSLDII
ncbi:hypothetical protein ACOMHN_007378 [Nucella lapillus]